MARTLVPWWTREIDAAIREKKRSLNRFKRYPTQLNIDKRAHAKARRLIVLAKTRSWEAYISSVTSETPISDVWRRVRVIGGKNCQFRPRRSRLATDCSSTARKWQRPWPPSSSRRVVPPTTNPPFSESKPNKEVPLNFTSLSDHEYNRPFQMAEMDAATSQRKTVCPRSR